jgi:DNA polymerase-3 subunit delta
MAWNPRIASVSAPPTVAVYWGEQPFLLHQAAQAFLGRHEVRAVEVDGSDWQGGETADVATPSLWGEPRALLVTNAQSLSEAGASELRRYLSAPSPDAICVLTLVTRGKNLPPLAKAAQAGGALVEQVALKRQELPQWVLDRAVARGAKLARPAAAALVATLGEDPAVLDQAVEQLASAFPGAVIGPEQVHAQFRGLGEQKVWDLCDQAFTGRVTEALITLRSLLDAKEDPLLVLGGVASRVRDLIRVRGLPDRMSSAEAVKAAGLRFDWQLRRYREQARRFGVAELIELHRRVTDCDRALKAGAGGDVVLPSLVAAMAGQAEAGLDLALRVSR